MIVFCPSALQGVHSSGLSLSMGGRDPRRENNRPVSVGTAAGENTLFNKTVGPHAYISDHARITRSLTAGKRSVPNSPVKTEDKPFEKTVATAPAVAGVFYVRWRTAQTTLNPDRRPIHVQPACRQGLQM